jgi:hypothetical protein
MENTSLKPRATAKPLAAIALALGSAVVGLAPSTAMAETMVIKRDQLQPIEACSGGPCSLNYGSTARMGEGTMKAYGFVEGGKTIKEIGVLMSRSILKGLPQNCGKDKPTPGSKWLICQASPKNPNGQMNDTMVTTLDMPKNVIDLANIDKLDISWLPFGHAPEKVWDKPQFDIHFPFRRPTGGQDSSRFYAPEVPKSQLPSGFMVLPGSGFHWDTEALQGHSHAADPKNSPEFAGGPFLANFLYITYDGSAIGYEVYASKALLESKDSYNRNLEMPEHSPGTNTVPSKLRITYEPQLDAYRVSLYDYKAVPDSVKNGNHSHGHQ